MLPLGVPFSCATCSPTQLQPHHAARQTAPCVLQVTQVTPLSHSALRVNMTTNLAVSVPVHPSQKQVRQAYQQAHLSKDKGIGRLSWTHTKEALGPKVQPVLEPSVTTRRLYPSRSSPPLWPKIVWPVVAACIILGSLMLIRVRRKLPFARSRAAATASAGQPQELAQFSTVPHELQVSSFVNAAVLPLMDGLRRTSYLASAGSGECQEDVEIGDMPPGARDRKRRQESERSGWVEEATVNPFHNASC